MAQFNESQNPLFEILEAISSIKLYEFDNDYEDNERKSEIVERGLPKVESSRKSEIQNRLISNQRKKSFIQKIDSLKEILKERNEMKGIKILASLINEILNPIQRSVFLKEINEPSQNTYNPSYGGFLGDSQYNYPTESEFGLVSRSGEPQNSILQGDVLDSITILEDKNQIKLPIEVKYNPSEVYLIHKGIHYCRMLLRNFNEKNNRLMLRELKSKEVLNIVLSEQINNDKNYISLLVDSFPKSLEEIKFILAEEQELLLKSSIFAILAMKNIRHLYQLLLELSNIMDKSVLSRACNQSQVNGIYVAYTLKQNFPQDIKVFADKISSFLNRYKEDTPF